MKDKVIDHFYFQEFGKSEEGSIYIVKLHNHEELFYKIGISKSQSRESLSLKRLKYIADYGYKVELIYFRTMNLFQAYMIEQAFIWLLKPVAYNPKIPFSGASECFAENPFEVLSGQPEVIDKSISESFDQLLSNAVESCGEYCMPSELIRMYIEDFNNWMIKIKYVNKFITEIKFDSINEDIILLQIVNLRYYFSKHEMKLQKAIINFKNNINTYLIKMGTQDEEIRQHMLSLRTGSRKVKVGDIEFVIKLDENLRKTTENCISALKLYKVKLEEQHGPNFSKLRATIRYLDTVRRESYLLIDAPL